VKESGGWNAAAAWGVALWSPSPGSGSMAGRPCCEDLRETNPGLKPRRNGTLENRENGGFNSELNSLLYRAGPQSCITPLQSLSF
jgi:hypothetical protein